MLKLYIILILLSTSIYARFENKYSMDKPIKNKNNLIYKSKEKTSTEFILFLKTDKKAFNKFIDKIEIEESENKIKVLEIENEMNIEHVLIDRKIGYIYIRNMYDDTLFIDIPKDLNINKFDNYIKYAEINNILNSFDKVILKKVRKKLLLTKK